MRTKLFQKTKENFICEKCGNSVIGDGYTNHCPKCLWSKHVDINPGDRQANCGGLMRPVDIEARAGKFYILHKCTKCFYERKNKVSKSDNFEEVIKISKISQ